MKSSGIGGQAVLEGVMMRNKSQYAVVIRKPDGELEVTTERCKSEEDRNIFFRLPLIRGVVAFVDSLVLGMKTLTYSAKFYEDDEPINKEEKKEDKKKTSKTSEGDAKKEEKTIAEKLEQREQIEMILTVVLSVVLALAVFVALPFGLSMLLRNKISSSVVLALIEGFIRIGLFVGYVYAISFMQDIRRVFMYHGAEHKTINCVESGEDLTVANVRKQSRHHRRCGTSFLFIVMLISIVFFMFLHFDNVWLRLLSRLFLVPVVAGVSYEFIRLAGNSDSKVVEVLSKPGMLLQKLTTREPEDSMIEVAIASVEAVFDWKEYQGRLAAMKKSEKRKKVAEEMMKTGMTAPIPKVDAKNEKKKTRAEIAEEIKKREQDNEKRADELKQRIKERAKFEERLARRIVGASERNARREAERKAKRSPMEKAQVEMAEDELESLDRFLDAPKGSQTPEQNMQEFKQRDRAAKK
ncbi:MAG: DUF1385 domain-containing protein [Lachnospiraceae bacterium]|nr:DUF1385 domain-containing protein [Lachnospiraceae bacterium]